ncbi:MAG: xanthine dehydrogenase family protein molybdopterin-binding subunit [Chloroflexi bacterium]|nr:xanthine dehydrogenase family protein molybdopterin-binding subunit [Chloroflexota bacterium]
MAEHTGHQPANQGAGIGAPLRRKETERFIQGVGTFADDVKLPNQAYTAFVRSIQPHAKIIGIDVAAARAVPGVLGVFTEPDWQEALGGHGLWPLAKGFVHYVGEPIAVVVGETRYQAQDGASAVVVHYEPLPAVVDSKQAMLPDAPLVLEDQPSNISMEIHFESEGKDVDRAFAEADHVVKARLRTQRTLTAPIEPKAAVASYDHTTGEATIWSSAAGVYAPRTEASLALGIPETKVRAIAADIGGSFGGKGGSVGENALLPVLARYLHRPVKWTEMRTDNLSTAPTGRDQVHDIELALRADGRVLGLRDRYVADVGATKRFGAAFTSTFLYLTAGYDIQRYKLDSYAVATDKAPCVAGVRGIGKADAGYTIERLMNIAAKELGMDPTEIRLKNFVREEEFPYRTATGAMLDSGRYAECLKMAMDLAGYEQLRKEQPELNTRPTLRRGIGVAFVIEPTGAARRNQGGGYGACRLKMELSGMISAYPAGGVQGQGHATTVSQIVADRLGCLPGNVHVTDGDSLVTPFGAGPGSSRTSQTVMPATLVAANLLRDKILRIAGHRLGLDPSTLRIEGDIVRGVERQIPLREVIQIAYQDVDRLPPGEDPALDVTGYFINENHVYDFDELGRRNEFSCYPYEAVIAVVDVDVETGQTEIVKYVSVHDCGTMINPKIVATQHLGAVVQGIGVAMFEEVRYDEEGKLLTGTFMDYLIPTAGDLPPFVFGHMETPTPFTPLGAKGAGETGTITAPCALGNAIEDALGVPVRLPPFTPERVLEAIEAGRAVTAGGARRV